MKTLKFKRGDRVFVKLYGEPELLKGVVSQLFPFHEKYRVTLEDGQELLFKEGDVYATKKQADKEFKKG